ncbi:MAG: transglutaminase domain-containing protein, partial [Clostridia bacterium]|nr:transglutaminase domain-containing protein [Clostridia bacterium]
MCREVGIPSRYVKGFAPLSKAGEDQFICNNNAHAWVEVYFDGYGWVTFEPSPYFAEKFYDISMNDYREDKTVFNEDGEQVPEPEQEEETKEETEEKAEQNETENKVITPEEKKAIATRKYIIAAVIVVCSATFLYLIGYSLVRRRKRQIKRFYRYDGRQFVYAAWYEIRRISKFDGQKIKADETPYTFLKRLGDEYGEKVLSLSADSFNKLLYSKKALITREDRAYAEAAYKALDKHISTRHKKWYFNLCRYILHII